MKKTAIPLFVLLLLTPFNLKGQAFHPGCQSAPGQLKNIKKNQPIDATCPIEGKGQDPSKAQNRAKNNFCSPNANSPVEVSVNELRALDALTEKRLSDKGIPFGTPTGVPPDRSELEKNFKVGDKNLREGMTVFIRAFVLDAHYSNLGNGESVNCNVGKKGNNDIHISLGTTLSSDQCAGITAEISPHFRPDPWADFTDYEFTHPVMLVGQLFYDASHKPCTAGHPVHPARISSWEIHPVYSIYVCKSTSGCTANSAHDIASKWTAFNDWVNLPDDEEEGHYMKEKQSEMDSFWAIKEILYRPELDI